MTPKLFSGRTSANVDMTVDLVKTHVERLFEIAHICELLWIYRGVGKQHGEIPDMEQHFESGGL